jgi:hypothetical protein
MDIFQTFSHDDEKPAMGWISSSERATTGDKRRGVDRSRVRKSRRLFLRRRVEDMFYTLWLIHTQSLFHSFLFTPFSIIHLWDQRSRHRL